MQRASLIPDLLLVSPQKSCFQSPVWVPLQGSKLCTKQPFPRGVFASRVTCFRFSSAAASSCCRCRAASASIISISAAAATASLFFRAASIISAYKASV
jgi:hypothetical protein